MVISIHPISMGIDMVYVLRGKSVIMIDGGTFSNVGKFIKGIEKASIRPEEIQLIVLTHGHFDHIGTSKAIKELTGAEVILHQDDLNLLEGTNPSVPPGLTTWGKISHLLLRMAAPFIHNPIIEVDRVISDEEFSLVEYGIPGKVVHTPGHTQGSVGVLLEDGKAFVGDLAMNWFPLRLSPGLPIFGDDTQVVIESWRKILDMGAKTIYPAHGKPFSAEVMRKVVF